MSTETKSLGERPNHCASPFWGGEREPPALRKSAIARYFCRRSLRAASCWQASRHWAQDGQYTQRGGTSRAGQYDNEVLLTPENVNTTYFGSLFSYSVDGAVAAQPLYVPNVTIPVVGTVNTIYAVTQNDSVYAFNAATPGTGQPLWQVNFLQRRERRELRCQSRPRAARGHRLHPRSASWELRSLIPTTNTMYLVAKTQEKRYGYQL